LYRREVDMPGLSPSIIEATPSTILIASPDLEIVESADSGDARTRQRETAAPMYKAHERPEEEDEAGN
jgi:hypothetical protein